MYEIWIILFCLFRAILMKYLNKRKASQSKKSQQSSIKGSQAQKQSQHIVPESPQEIQLKQLKNRKKQIEQTIEQFNNPSTFAKYSKMQRQFTKINNQINSLQEQISKKKSQFPQQNSATQPPSSQKPSLLDVRKKQVQDIHRKIGNKQLLVKAMINLGLIIGCSYVQSSQLPLCAGYPMYGFCNQSGRINGGWIFVISSVLFSY